MSSADQPKPIDPAALVFHNETKHKGYVPNVAGPTSSAFQLRDLAQKIEDLCRSHPAYSMAWPVIQNASDHLQAKARVSETNADR